MSDSQTNEDSASPRTRESKLRTALDRFPPHTWVLKVQHGNCEIQRLSRFALRERRKHNYRFRLLKDGEIQAHFETTQELEAALGPEGPYANDLLLAKWMESKREGEDSPKRYFSPLSYSKKSPTSGPSSPTTARPPTPTSLTASQVSADATPRRPSVPVEPPSLAMGGPKDNKILAPTDGPDIWVTVATARGSVDKGRPIVEAASQSSSSSPPVQTNGNAAPTPAPSAPAAPAEALAAGTIEGTKRKHTPSAPVNPRQEPVQTKEEVLAWYYSEDTGEWTMKETVVRLAEEPFAEGGLRLAYKMGMDDGAGEKLFVAKMFNNYTEKELIAPTDDMFAGQDPEKKMSKDWMIRTFERQGGWDFELQVARRILPDNSEMTLREILTFQRRMKLYRGDVEMQMFCKQYATEYNKRRPPKLVNFLDAFIIVCHKRPTRNVYACEPMLLGEYNKYNNNSGQVEEGQERNTPQAFSHFTYFLSDQKHIIVDIQGVGDTYTDPQVHSVEGRFGMGNLGQDGIDSFMKSHVCNNICKGLGLVPASKHVAIAGTVYRKDAPQFSF